MPAFIDRLYGEFMTPAEQQLLTQGLAEIEAAAKSAHGAAFATLTADAAGRRAAQRGHGAAGTGFQLVRG